MADCKVVYEADVEYGPFLFDRNTYTKEWVAFLNRDGSPRYVNLTYSNEEIEEQERVTSILKGHGEVAFYLYTKKNPENPEELKYPNYKSDYLDPKAPFYILVHGWLQDLKSEFPRIVKDAILKKWRTSINVIVMDWYSMQSYNYVTTAKRTDDASKALTHAIEDLSKKYGINGSSIHIVGHGLGAHVAGLAGKQMRRLNFIISRITGLDPTRAYFEHPKRYEGISKESAAFVDVIHTSINALGITKPAGTSDFYPNGGTVLQPVCCPKRVPGLPGACEHKCAYIYYANSFTKNYEAVKCDNYIDYKHRVCDMDEIQNMGEPTLNWSHGLYFVDIFPDENNK